MIENWPGRGYYRGDKQAMLNDMAKLFDGTMLATIPPMGPEPVQLAPAQIEVETIPATEPGDPRSRGYTGNECTDCHSTRMVIAGHCEVCTDCGSSSGCS